MIPNSADLRMVVDWVDESGEPHHMELAFDPSDPQAAIAKQMLIAMFNQGIAQN